MLRGGIIFNSIPKLTNEKTIEEIIKISEIRFRLTSFIAPPAQKNIKADKVTARPIFEREVEEEVIKDKTAWIINRNQKMATSLEILNFIPLGRFLPRTNPKIPTVIKK